MATKIEPLAPEMEKIIDVSQTIQHLADVPGQGVTVFKGPTNRANGLTRDLQGRLLACEHDSRRVTRQELDGRLTVIANSFQGRRSTAPTTWW